MKVSRRTVVWEVCVIGCWHLSTPCSEAKPVTIHHAGPDYLPQPQPPPPPGPAPSLCFVLRQLVQECLRGYSGQAEVFMLLLPSADGANDTKAPCHTKDEAVVEHQACQHTHPPQPIPQPLTPTCCCHTGNVPHQPHHPSLDSSCRPSCPFLQSSAQNDETSAVALTQRGRAKPLKAIFTPSTLRHAHSYSQLRITSKGRKPQKMRPKKGIVCQLASTAVLHWHMAHMGKV